MTEPIYHLEDVAQICGVSIDVVKSWLDRGLRHLPLGPATSYACRDALVRHSWLVDWLECQSVVRPRKRPEGPPPVTVAPERPRPRAKAAKRPGSASIIGPCPV